jgi:hypothetical protein
VDLPEEKAIRKENDKLQGKENLNIRKRKTWKVKKPSELKN